MDDMDDILTAAEAAARLRVDKSTVLRWARAGELRGSKLPGGEWRFALADVDKLLKPDDAA